MTGKFILSVLFSFLVNGIYAQVFQLSIANSYGNTTSNDEGKSVWVDAGKNIYTTGNFSGTVDFNPGPDVNNLTSTSFPSVFIQKLDPSGDLLWARAVGITDANGNSFIKPNDITADADGNVIVVGEFQGTADFNPSPGGDSSISSLGNSGGIFNPPPTYNIFVLKLDIDGNFLWAFRLGATASIIAGGGSASSAITDNTGNIYVAGSFGNNVDFDPGNNQNVINGGIGGYFILKVNPSGTYSWVSTSGGSLGNGINDIRYHQGNIYYTGIANSSIGSIGHLLVGKMDLSGNNIWKREVYGAHNVMGASLCIDNNGNVITTGSFGDPAVDFDPGSGIDSVFNLNSANGAAFIQKLDPSGKFVWAKNFDGTTNSITTDMDGNTYAVGYFTGSANFDPADIQPPLTTAGTVAFIQKLDPSGLYKWAGQFGNSGNESANSISVDDQKFIYISGYFSGTQDFNPNSGTGPANVTEMTSNSGSRDIFFIKLNDAIVIPVKMISFTGYAIENKTILQWQTTDEQNASVYKIQHGTNGNDFTTIGTVNAENTTGTKNYNFIHHNPVSGANFYRLIPVDRDGRFSYSKIISVIFKRPSSQVFPNPTGGEINIRSAGILKAVVVYDLSGKRLMNFLPNPGNKYDLNGLPSGNYKIRLQYQDESETITVTKKSD